MQNGASGLPNIILASRGLKVKMLMSLELHDFFLLYFYQILHA